MANGPFLFQNSFSHLLKQSVHHIPAHESSCTGIERGIEKRGGAGNFDQPTPEQQRGTLRQPPGLKDVVRYHS